MEKLTYYQIYIIDESNQKKPLNISFKNEDEAKSFVMVKRAFDPKLNINYVKQSTTVYDSVADFASSKQQKIDFIEK